jgi:hypothetical protein
LAAIAGCSENSPGAGSSLDERYAAALKQTNPETRAGTLVALSSDQHAAGDTAGAAESLATATQAVAELPHPGAQAKALLRISTAQASQGGLKTAAATLLKAEQAVHKESDPAVKADVLARIGSLYARSLKQVAPAIVAIEAAQKAAGGIADPQARVDAYCTVAKAYATLKQPADVKRMLNFAEQMAGAGQTSRADELLGEAKKLADGINDTGLKQEAAGRVKSAREKMK